MKPNLLAYALDTVSFILEKTANKEQIKQIILFGSVAREEAGPESDIDIFIDVIKEDKELEKELYDILERFNKSIKYQNYWRMQGVEQEIKLTIGKASSWKELLPSLVADGIILYGKFTASLEGKHQTIFVWENITPNAKRVAVNKKLFGHTHRKKYYPGLLELYQGQRLGKGCIVVDLAHAKLLHQVFKKYKIAVKIKNVIAY
ncbi:nucleotidyltransferase domain-containing protein [Candidatus Woesearchaeota archaeon]|nr:nucleotidyltransferase domain-containing protein [Candidatus Woesearchaeota archaeon]